MQLYGESFSLLPTRFIYKPSGLLIIFLLATLICSTSFIPGQLRDLNLLLELTFEAGEQNLALARLETVDHRRDRAFVVRC